jgi:hypothetical protein
METEERHWKNLSDDLNRRLHPGDTINSTVTVQNR